jgi:disulfide bond formation protein DsbB
MGRGLSATDLLDQISRAPLVRCDEVQWRFLGISMAGWNAILSLGGAVSIVLLSRRGRRA